MVARRLLAALTALSLIFAGAGVAQAAGKRRPPVVITPGGGYPYPPPPPVYGSPYVTVRPVAPPRRPGPPPAAQTPAPRGMLELIFAGETTWLFVAPDSLRRVGDAADMTILMVPVKVRGGVSYLAGRARLDCARRTVRITTLSGYSPSGAYMGATNRVELPSTKVGAGGYRLVERACDEDVDAQRLRLQDFGQALQMVRYGMDTLRMPPEGYDGMGLALPGGRLTAYASNTVGGVDFVAMDTIRPDGRGLRASLLRIAEAPFEIKGAKAAFAVTEVKVDCPRKRAWVRLVVYYDENRRYITEVPGEGPDLPGLYGVTSLAFGLVCGIDQPEEAQTAYGLDDAIALSRKAGKRLHGRVTS